MLRGSGDAGCELLGVDHGGDPKDQPYRVFAIHELERHFHEGRAAGVGGRPLGFPFLSRFVEEAPAEGGDAIHEREPVADEFRFIKLALGPCGGLLVVEVKNGRLETEIDGFLGAEEDGFGTCVDPRP